MVKNSNLHKAKNEKNDEFYTQLTDIEKELKHYKDQFKGKTIFCNCDDPDWSNFWAFFSLNFNHFGLKKLISTHYDASAPTYKMERTGMTDDDVKITPLRCNGDFRSDEAINILMESDIVVTNPPFSLFREYIAQLMNYEKNFLVIGSMNAITYKEIFPSIKNNALWLGMTTGARAFILPKNAPEKSTDKIIDGKRCTVLGNTCWFTNITHSKRNQPIELYHTYRGHEENYPRYDNYDAIEVSKVKDIPCDYDGAMGVPITFLEKYCPDQFEILGITAGRDEFECRPSKRYKNPVQHNANGSTSNRSKANTRSTILIDRTPSGTYYTADNADSKFLIVYARILIKTKQRSYMPHMDAGQRTSKRPCNPHLSAKIFEDLARDGQIEQ